MIELVAQGLDVQGLDSSRDMLARCEAKARAHGLSVSLYQQDMRSLTLPIRYRTIFLAGASFMLLSEAGDAERALRRIHDHLEPGGRVIIPLYMPPPRERQEKARGLDPYRRKRQDSSPVAAWRARLGTEEGQQVYARRREVAEWVFAGWANRGWHKFRVRGLRKTQAQGCWQGLAHNALRLRALAQKERAA